MLQFNINLGRSNFQQLVFIKIMTIINANAHLVLELHINILSNEKQAAKLWSCESRKSEDPGHRKAKAIYHSNPENTLPNCDRYLQWLWLMRLVNGSDHLDLDQSSWCLCFIHAWELYTELYTCLHLGLQGKLIFRMLEYYWRILPFVFQ